MKIKLDLHPIFNDSLKIESELSRVIDEAVAKRASEVEIIPGKGSGALKKTVIRFLDRPDVKARYHRLEKDSDNWGRLFVHFRHDRVAVPAPRAAAAVAETFACACCGQLCPISSGLVDAVGISTSASLIECASCGTPNRVSVWMDRNQKLHSKVELGYE